MTSALISCCTQLVLMPPGYATYVNCNLESDGWINSRMYLTDWKGSYRSTFVNSKSNTATSSLNKLVNDFIFYYEKGLRANKIGIPAGVFSASPLPEQGGGILQKRYF